MWTNTIEQQDALLEVALPPREEPKCRYNTITCKCEARAFQYLQREAKARAPKETPNISGFQASKRSSLWKMKSGIFA